VAGEILTVGSRLKAGVGRDVRTGDQRHAAKGRAIDALDAGVRGGPDADSITVETYGKEIPEA
jgi:hypothetical protein